MNIESASRDSSSNGPPTPLNSRKERGAIAAQACENCRQRKQRCSEDRPRCTSCQRMNLDCRYREPQPTKKDKTLVEILDRLKSLEHKVENIGQGGSNYSPASGYETRSPNPRGPTPIILAPDARDQVRTGQWPSSDVHPPAPLGHASPRQAHYSYSSATYKVLSWPFVQQFLGSSKKTATMVEPLVKKNGAAVMLDLHARATPLPQDTFEMAASRRGSMAPSIEVPLRNPLGGLHMDPMSFSWENMHRLSKAYFDTFNLLYPFMDRAQFQTEILSAVATNGFDESLNSTLACLCSLENVQVFSLASIYYETCCHHVEFWRMATSASLACQALLTSNPDELKSHRADLVRRMFWHCIMTETYLNLEFNLPLTGLEKFDDMVGLPDFSAGSFSEEDYIGNQASHFQEHFASQIVLRRLVVEFHTTLTGAIGAAETRQPSLQATDNSASANPTATIKQLAMQLDRWRGMLPSHLCWQDDPANTGHVYPPPVPSMHDSFVFTADLDAPPVIYPFAADIQAAILRTRYYYVKFLLHRPYIYKALHHPESMTHEDAEGVAIALKSTLRNQKRLIPCLYCWSQKFLAVLLILHLSQQVPILARIRATHLGDRFNTDAKQTTALYIDWIRDLKDIDPTALWCWSILKEVYSLEE
ncbi:JmjC domain-containing protein [Apiospora arundinis]